MPDHWLPLDILLDGDRLFDFTQHLRKWGGRGLAKEAENLANVFRDYIIPIVPLVTEELDIVTDAFVRINSQGKGMTEAHMLRALTHLQAIDTERHFERVRERLEPLGWGELDDQVLVNILKAQLGLDVYAASVRGVLDRLQRDAGPLNALPDNVGGSRERSRSNHAAYEGLPRSHTCKPPARHPGRDRSSLSLGKLEQASPFLVGLERWFWTTTYAEEFTGMTGNRIRDGIEDLAQQLQSPQPAKYPIYTRVMGLYDLRMSTVRARAFLLFLAQLPNDENARRRRQERLGMGDPKAVPILFSGESRTNPANRVIADLTELRDVRAMLRRRPPSPSRQLQFDLTADAPDEIESWLAQADEFGIPDEALNAIPDQKAFLDVRRGWLLEREEEFVRPFDLKMEY